MKGRSVYGIARSAAPFVLVALLVTSCLSLSARPPLSDSERPVLDLLRDVQRPIFWPAVHRGNMEYGQGNSLAGIEISARAGAALIEIDLRMNRAGSIFLFHDGRLREENFAGESAHYGQRPEDLDDAGLAELCYPNSQVCAPSFAEALRAVAPYRTVFLLDVKNPSLLLLDRIVAEASRREQLSQVIVQCQDAAMLRVVREKYPDLALLARAFSPADVAAALPLRPLIVHADEEWLNESLIRTIRRHGGRVMVKTLDTQGDDEAHWLRLRRKGVEIVLTDRFRRFEHLPRRRAAE